MSRATDRGAASLASELRIEQALFVLLAFLLTAFGLLMIFSASSIEALTSADTGHDPAFYVKRQLLFMVMGLVVAVIIALFDYHLWSATLMPVIGAVVIAMLVLVLTPLAGADAYGATRWLAVGPIHLQPSEFAKASVLLASASIIERWAYGLEDLREQWMFIGGLVLLPLVLILRQPDKGTTLIICIMVMTLFFIAGMPLKLVLIGVACGLGVIGFLAVFDSYSLARIQMAWDPWKDPYDSGYQLIQGLLAFGSGGLTGVGLGNSRQKYSYLPMAHNDFIYAVIGEEWGLVGTIGMLLAFVALVYLGLRIARKAPDLSGRLIASGSVITLGVQMLVNTAGVLCLIPLSGKPIPFISYGGSSIISTLVLVGLVISVSRASLNALSSSREGFSVVEGSSPRGFRVIEGGGRTTPDDLRSERDFSMAYGSGRVTTNANGSRRINLGPSASDRLRGRDMGRGGRG